MRTSTLTILAACGVAAAPLIAAPTVQAPVRTTAGIGTWTMSSTVTADPALTTTVELWSTVFKIGTDGQILRRSITLAPGTTGKVSVNCYATTATIGWWTIARTSAGSTRSTTTWVKCR